MNMCFLSVQKIHTKYFVPMHKNCGTLKGISSRFDTFVINTE